VTDDRVEGATRSPAAVSSDALVIPPASSDPSLPWQADGWLATYMPGPGGPRGTVAVRSGDSFDRDDERVLVLLAQTAATAIDAAELYRAIEASETRWRVLVEAAPVGIVEVDVGGSVQWWNRAATALFGWPDVTSSSVPADVHPEFSVRAGKKLRELWSEVAGDVEVIGREVLAVPAGGERRDLIVSAVPLRNVEGAVQGILTLVSDVTDRRRLADELRQAERMEAVGQLAGSVAHEFNNLLTLISGYTELLRRHLKVDERAGALLGDLQGATLRASTLTGQLLNLSGHSSLRPVVLAPASAIRSLAEVLERVVPAEVELIWTLDERAGQVRIDEGQFEQLVVNLAVNARDAIVGSGEIHIAVGGVDVEAEQAIELGLRSGRYVRIAVRDTGSGMANETRSRCFEPLYTTKGSSKGTGLGLPAVRRSVLTCGGAIRFDSALGVGTTFEVFLPAIEERSQRREGDRDKSRTGVRRAAARLDGRATVLLAEDDEGLRLLVRRVLAHGGYNVLEAASGSEALEIAQASTTTIDLLVTDEVMPGLSGRDLAMRLREILPGLAVLLVSGTTDERIIAGLGDGAIEFLAKPFKPSDVIERVQWLLDATSANESGG
jgi:PAS domain S-box-containing protein